MEDDSSWLLEDWNGTDRGDFGSCCRVSVYRMDVWMMRNVGCRCRTSGWWGILAGWMAFLCVDRCGPLRVFFSSSVRVDYVRSVESTSQMWDVRPVHVASLFWDLNDEHERENVLHNDCWVLDEDREEMFSSSGFRFAKQLVDSFRSSCLPLNPGIPCVNPGFRLVRVCSSVQQNRVPRRVDCRFLPPRVIGDVGPYCGPSGVAATVRVDARFQGTIVRGLGYPSCRPSPCGPRRQFDIGDSCVRSKKQL